MVRKWIIKQRTPSHCHLPRCCPSPHSPSLRSQFAVPNKNHKEKTAIMGATDSNVVKPTPREAVAEDLAGDGTSMKDHWNCLAACTLVSMCPFQYGIDFGLIGGLQAMPGFLQVSCALLYQQHLSIQRWPFPPARQMQECRWRRVSSPSADCQRTRSSATRPRILPSAGTSRRSVSS